jgi:hypothetical protein
MQFLLQRPTQVQISSIPHHHLGISWWGNSGSNINLGPFTLEVIADIQPKWSIPIGAKVEISPKGFTLGVKAQLEKIFSICPKLLINAELYDLVLAPRLEKGYHGIWEANLKTLGANVSALPHSQKCPKLAPSFLGHDS